MDDYKTLLMGCGRIAQLHSEILAKGQASGVTLAGVCDIIPVRAEELGKKYNVPWFSDVNQAIEKVRPDILSVLTPTGMHVAHVLDLIPHRIPLLVEKPLALYPADVTRIIKAQQQHGTPITEVKQNRYNHAVDHLKLAIVTRRLGAIRLAGVRVLWSRNREYFNDWHGQFSMAGGVLANQAIHHLDLLWWLVGDVKRVSAFWTHDDYTEVETGIVATLEFVNGCLATFQATTLTQPKDLEGSLTIIGEQGTVELGGFAVNNIKTWQFNEESILDERIRRICENPPNVYGYGHASLYEDFRFRLSNNEPVPVTLDQSLAVVELCQAIYESAATGSIIEVNNDHH